MATHLEYVSGVGKRGLSTFNEKIEIAKNSLKVPIRDFYFIKTEHCFVNHATLAGLADLHFGTFYKCDYLTATEKVDSPFKYDLHT